MVTTGDGNTPLSPEEEADLIPNLATRGELNEWERQNILEAWAWALDAKTIQRLDPLGESYVRELHLRMFDQTWKWAGKYRATEKNIGALTIKYAIRLECCLAMPGTGSITGPL